MKPCKFDHNGECLICDCWPSDCQYNKLIQKKCESKEEVEALIKMFKDFLTEDEIKNCRDLPA